MEFKSFNQSIVAFFMAALAHLDVAASILALVVLLFQLKVVYYNSKIKKMEYEKEIKQ